MAETRANPPLAYLTGIAACLLMSAESGCGPASDDLPNLAPAPRPAARRIYSAPTVPSKAEYSSDTERDRAFGSLLDELSAGRIAKAAIGIEKAGMLRIDMDRSVPPEDLLAMVGALLSRGRQDYPGRPITIAIFDPGREPILKARFRPGQGVRYQIVPSKPRMTRPDPAQPPDDGQAEPPSRAGSRIASSGMTDRDVEYARWAADQEKARLEYLEVDVEQDGRLWLGVSRDVKPDDLPGLMGPLLGRAHSRFPEVEISVSVFNPEGDRIGKALLDRAGEIRWE